MAKNEITTSALPKGEVAPLIKGMNPSHVAYAMAIASGFKSSRASEIAGYTSNRSELQKDPNVIELVTKFRRASFMGADEALALLAKKARTTMDDFLDIDDHGHTKINVRKARELGSTGAIKRIKTRTITHEDGSVTQTVDLEIADPMDALKFVAKDLGLAQEQINITITNAVDVVLAIVEQQVDRESYQRILLAIQAYDLKRVTG